MCGIAGIAMRGHAPLPAETLAAMNHALIHRGPDGDGTVICGDMGITHRRLSIIDVQGGQQPISDAEGKIHIAVNGEIYNYQPLRDMLEAEGVHCKTASDSEVPLHLYRKFGLDFINYLDGMYALVILDEHKGEMILARDPVGIKPLYTCVTEKGVAFASEASALTESGWTTPELNTDALPAFLNRQYVPGDATLFKGIHRVAPGEVIRIRQGAISDRYVVPLDLRAHSHMSEEDAISAFDGLLSEKVTTHLQSEVPYGAFLSGGIDSSAVVSRMADISANIRSYTVGFSNVSTADERSMAEGLARQLGTQHHSVEFSERDFWHYLPQLCNALDDLAADYAALPTLKLAQCAATDVKVILSGEGGDEIFAGYGRYRHQSLWRRLMGRPLRGRGDAARFGQVFREPKRFAEYHKTEIPARSLLKRGLSPLQTYQAQDIAEWLPNDLLLKLDRCLMAYGIEGRVPLLDREMLCFVFALPDSLKIRRQQGKWLLKKWLHRRHPDLRVWQPKRGFTVPIHEWMEKKREKLSAMLATHPALESIIDPPRFRAWLAKPLDAKGAKLLFNMLCLTIWYDIHIRGTSGHLPI
jgi:asparagine synthase (glutamine-hydrolysing)